MFFFTFLNPIPDNEWLSAYTETGKLLETDIPSQWAPYHASTHVKLAVLWECSADVYNQSALANLPRGSALPSIDRTTLTIVTADMQGLIYVHFALFHLFFLNCCWRFFPLLVAIFNFFFPGLHIILSKYSWNGYKSMWLGLTNEFIKLGHTRKARGAPPHRTLMLSTKNQR